MCERGRRWPSPRTHPPLGPSCCHAKMIANEETGRRSPLASVPNPPFTGAASHIIRAPRTDGNPRRMFVPRKISRDVGPAVSLRAFPPAFRNRSGCGGNASKPAMPDAQVSHVRLLRSARTAVASVLRRTRNAAADARVCKAIRTIAARAGALALLGISAKAATAIRSSNGGVSQRFPSAEATAPYCANARTRCDRPVRLQRSNAKDTNCRLIPFLAEAPPKSSACSICSRIRRADFSVRPFAIPRGMRGAGPSRR
jgi:hypothetical protein